MMRCSLKQDEPRNGSVVELSWVLLCTLVGCKVY